MIRTSHALLFGAITVLLVGTLAFGTGWVTARSVGTTPLDTLLAEFGLSDERQATPADLRDEFAVFWRVWALVEGEFYHTEPLDHQRMVYGAIKGMLSSLDDEYTSFQEPDLAAASRESMQGTFEGIGAFLRYEDGQIVIDRLFAEGPAEQAGVHAGDQIVAIDGVELTPLLAGLSNEEATAIAVERIRGPKGTVVTLSLRRPPAAETVEVAITRDELPLITVNARMIEDDVAYIQITEFKANTAELLDQALRELIPQQPRSIVLDLRNNPGGYLRTAQEVLGRFYKGVALYEQEGGGVEKELPTIPGSAETQLYDIPMVVLINNGSASAAEIVAGALRDERPGTTLVGERSFGKGSVQNIHQLEDGSSARITIARWFTPSHASIHRVGITPEYEVAASDDPAYSVPCIIEGESDCHDAQLAWGLTFLADRLSQR